MKKFIAIAAVAISLTACNSGTTEQTPVTTTDTVTVKADTTMVIIDSTVLDSSKAAE